MPLMLLGGQSKRRVLSAAAWLVLAVLLIRDAAAQTGACCLGDGGCVETDLAGCNLGAGEFLGPGTLCVETTCQGACCLPSGTCSVTTANACSSGDYQGAGTECAAHCPGPAGSSFTYQGRLDLSGNPLNNTVDLEFTLWDTLDGGGMIGAAVRVSNVFVVDGRFDVALDFGVNAFDGDKRWMEVAVRSPHDPSDTQPMTTLSPRRAVRAAPYALTALEALNVPDGHSLDAADGNPADALYVNEFGHVEIGTEKRSSSLDVRGRIASTWMSSGGGFCVGDACAAMVGTGNSVNGVIGSTSQAGRAGIRGIAESATAYSGYFSGPLGSRTYFEQDVGIGRQTPDGKLEVRQSGAADILNLYDGNVNVLSVLDGGNVGIGSTNPQAPLQVGEGDDARIQLGVSPQLSLTRDVADNKFRIQIEGSNYGGKHLQLGRDDGAHDVVVTGDLGVGTSAPSARLDVVGSAEVNGDLRVDSPTFFVDATSNRVGLGTTTPSQRLHVVGNVCVTGTVAQCSDERLKSNLRNIGDALSLVSRLRGVRFDWRRDAFPHHEFSEAPQIGFIAQEIEQILPHVVSEGSDGFLSVDYGRLAPVIVEAIKQLQAQTDVELTALHTENAALRAKNVELEQRLARIECRLASFSGNTGMGADAR